MLNDIPRLCGYFFEDPTYDSLDSKEMLEKIHSTTSPQALADFLFDLELSLKTIAFNPKDIEYSLSTSKQNFVNTMPSHIAMMAVRWAITGTKVPRLLLYV
jgi:hypothetical protein